VARAVTRAQRARIARVEARLKDLEATRRRQLPHSDRYWERLGASRYRCLIDPGYTDTVFIAPEPEPRDAAYLRRLNAEIDELLAGYSHDPEAWWSLAPFPHPPPCLKSHPHDDPCAACSQWKTDVETLVDEQSTGNSDFDLMFEVVVEGFRLPVTETTWQTFWNRRTAWRKTFEQASADARANDWKHHRR
jgi:hypothetical protein